MKALSNKKYRLILIAISLALVVMMAVFSVTMIYGQPSANSGLNISYALEEGVNIKAVGYYQYEGSDMVSIGQVELNASESSTGQLPAQDLNLTVDVRAVRFVYLFENSTGEEIRITSTWQDFENNVNADGSSIDGAPALNNKNMFVNSDVYASIDDVPDEFNKGIGLKDEVLYLSDDSNIGVIVITISIANINHSAFCHSDEDGGLTFYIETI